MALQSDSTFVSWFRAAAPYFHAFRGRTFVIAFGGELVAEGKFVALAHDLNLLHSAGIRLVLVHGSRPQIEAQLRQRRTKSRYLNGLRI
ncbi:MAG: amino-acid N-acetyltransferase, partial [Burkholderiales bacterium]|nr:amino-acid N-acetyltransferase [Burkholderiales bacterium]